MPKRLKILVVLMVVSMVLDIVVMLLFGAGVQDWFRLAIVVLLLIGMLRGHEAVRTYLLWGAWIGAITNGGAALFAIAAFVFVGTLFGSDTAALTGEERALIFGVPALLLFHTAMSVYMIICLRRGDVQQWMFNRSLRQSEGA